MNYQFSSTVRTITLSNFLCPPKSNWNDPPTTVSHNSLFFRGMKQTAHKAYITEYEHLYAESIRESVGYTTQAELLLTHLLWDFILAILLILKLVERLLLLEKVMEALVHA